MVAVIPDAPLVAVPVGVDGHGADVSLFDLPGPVIALRGPGADPAARAVLASTLATGMFDPPPLRPVVVTTTNTLTRLLPAGPAPVGLDPAGTGFDAERLIVLTDTAAAVTHAEEEMITRRRLLESLDATTITALNERTDHAEAQPPYLLLIDADHNTPPASARSPPTAPPCTYTP